MTLRPPSSTLFPYTTLFRSINYFFSFDGNVISFCSKQFIESNSRSFDGFIFFKTFCCFFYHSKCLRKNFVQHFLDRKSTRLNSSHTVISYAVFCLKKKKTFE